MRRLALGAWMVHISCSYAVAVVPGPPPCTRVPAVLDTAAAAGSALLGLIVAISEARYQALADNEKSSDDDGTGHLIAKILIAYAAAGTLGYGLSAHHGYTWTCED